ncbi:MAG: hypothetical protein AMXMBFR53_31510 [Gemmatimonadota bacterium]
MATTEKGSDGGRVTLSRDQLWPIIIIVALALVMLVNAVFIYIAVSGADEVAPSYTQGDR